jgi:GntR family transcriptional regulator
LGAPLVIAVASKHEAVRGYLLQAMRSDLGRGGRLPSEREIADRVGVSRPTVRRALDQLAAEGRVHRVQGSGTFVAAPPAPAVRVLAATATLAGAERSWRLGVSPAEPLWRIERLRFADAVPTCLETTYLVKTLTPGVLDRPLDAAVCDLLAKHYGIVIHGTRQSINATVLDAPTASLLDAPPLSAALLIERVSWDEEQRRVELTQRICRGDRCLLEVIETASDGCRGSRAPRLLTLTAR